MRVLRKPPPRPGVCCAMPRYVAYTSAVPVAFSLAANCATLLPASGVKLAPAAPAVAVKPAGAGPATNALPAASMATAAGAMFGSRVEYGNESAAAQIFVTKPIVAAVVGQPQAEVPTTYELPAASPATAVITALPADGTNTSRYAVLPSALSLAIAGPWSVSRPSRPTVTPAARVNVIVGCTQPAELH